MSSKLLSLVDAIDLPTQIAATRLRADTISVACTAAKTLRNRILKEIERVTKAMEEVGWGEGDDEEEAADPFDEHYGLKGAGRGQYTVEKAKREDMTGQLIRKDFLALGRMGAVERIVAPVLIRHGAAHPDTILPQYLKLLAAMTMPPPPGSLEMAQQQDVLRNVRTRLASEDFFTLLANCAAPLAARRLTESLSHDDGVLIEVVLALFTNLLKGPQKDIEQLVVVMCRTHCVELLRVLLRQNAVKAEQIAAQAADPANRTSVSQPRTDELLVIEQPTTEAAATTEPNCEATTANSDATAGANSEVAEATTTTVVDGTALPETATGQGGSGFVVVAATEEEIGSGEGKAAAEETQEAQAATAPPSFGSLGALAGGSSGVVEFGAAGAAGTQLAIGTQSQFELLVATAANTQLTVLATQEAPQEGGTATTEEAPDDEQKSTRRAAMVETPPPAPPEGAIRNEAGEENEEEEEEEAKSSESSSSSSAEEEEEDEEDEEDLDPFSEKALAKDAVLAQLLAEREEEMRGESAAQIQRWNFLVMEAVALIFRCAPPYDLATVAPSAATSTAAAIQARLSGTLLEAKRQHDEWRRIAQSRPGATASSSLLVKRGGVGAIGDIAATHLTVVGSSLSVLSPIDATAPHSAAQEMDKAKKGRFQKGREMPPPATTLPLPAQVRLAREVAEFLENGFDSLSVMVWPELVKRVQEMHENVKAGREYRAFALNRAEEGPMLQGTDLDATQVGDVLNYCFLCGAMLKFTRLSLMQVLAEHPSLADALTNSARSGDAALFGRLQTIQAQWQSVSAVMTLGHLTASFSLLDCFLTDKEINSKHDIVIVTDFLAELLLLLFHVMSGDISPDPQVKMSAHALASSLLYKEEHIRLIFSLVSSVSHTAVKSRILQSYVLVVYAAFRLMDGVAYNGILPMPKRRPTNQSDALHAESGGSSVVRDGEEEAESGSEDDEVGSEDDAGFIDNTEELEARKKKEERRRRKEAEKNGAHYEPPEELVEDPAEKAVDEEQEPHPDGAPQEEEGDEEHNQKPSEGVEEGAGGETSRGGSSARDRSVSGAPTTSDRSKPSAMTGASSLPSEREVRVSEYYSKLAIPKNAHLLLQALRTWRFNSPDVNDALAFLMRRLYEHCSYSAVFWQLNFFLIFSDMLHASATSSSASHCSAIVEIVDRIVKDFFNPQFTVSIFSEQQQQQLRSDGRQPFDADDDRRFIVALRCARSLFAMAASDVNILDSNLQPLDDVARAKAAMSDPFDVAWSDDGSYREEEIGAEGGADDGGDDNGGDDDAEDAIEALAHAKEAQRLQKEEKRKLKKKEKKKKKKHRHHHHHHHRHHHSEGGAEEQGGAMTTRGMTRKRERDHADTAPVAELPSVIDGSSSSDADDDDDSERKRLRMDLKQQLQRKEEVEEEEEGYRAKEAAKLAEIQRAAAIDAPHRVELTAATATATATATTTVDVENDKFAVEVAPHTGVLVDEESD